MKLIFGTMNPHKNKNEHKYLKKKKKKITSIFQIKNRQDFFFLDFT